MPVRQDLVDLIADIDTALETLNGTPTVQGIIPQLEALVAAI